MRARSVAAERGSARSWPGRLAGALLMAVIVLAHPGLVAAAPTSSASVGATAAGTAGAWPETTLEIPRIGVNRPVSEGHGASVLARGPGHTPGTGLPGQPGNVVIPGHRTLSPRPFHDIDKLQPGDEMILTTPAGRFVYRMTSSTIVAPEGIWVTAPTPEPTITIYACHPKGSDRQRYVVFGQLVPAPAPAPAPAPPPPPPPPKTVLGFCLAILGCKGQ